ncbi:tetratricopeptide repeat protein [Desulfolutivibrio sulfoxidireducens]|uniref:tetratricopeptide repeat protein n=1 Tax=Desulfolutivibrio sulfoxidireducens TaxID=2773299 RepID=UPI00159D49C5|nr:tetratricopeptide repeat protein [Desulfolutivibrio sulfoxidireducens]QLA18862.1 tetratricopeptide repeat protein [Desulfolutivibrio sulfoxidireducens]
MKNVNPNDILGMIKSGHFEVAEKELDMCLSKDQCNLEALQLKARLLLTRRDWPNAVSQIEKIVNNINDKNLTGRKKIIASAITDAKNAMKSKNWHEAARCWRVAYDILGDDATDEVYYGLCRAYRLKGNIVEAERIAAKGVKKFNNLKISTEYAEIAMSLQDWKNAVTRWHHVLRSFGDAVPLRVHSRLSRACFRLDDALHASNNINILLNACPNDLIGLIEIKNQMFSQAIKLETLNTIWEESSNRPDWLALVNLCETLLRMTTGKQHHGVEKQLVLAKLFLMEEYFAAGNWDEALSTLQSNLQIICGSLANNLPDLLISCVDFIRSGASTKEINSQLLVCLRNTDVHSLTRSQWILLYDVLAWNGLFYCGLESRKKAIKKTHIEANEDSSNETFIMHATLASIEQSDFLTAKSYLNMLASLECSQKLHDELLSYYNLCSGNIASFQEYISLTFTFEDIDFYSYIQDKTVAIVGPAPTDSDDGQEIDASDVVLRFNYLGRKSLPESLKHGNKINISLYSDSILYHTSQHDIELHLNDLDFIIYRTMQYEIPSYFRVKGKRLKQNRHFFHKAPNAVPAALYEILAYKPARVKVYKSNFFLSRQAYDKNYFLLDSFSDDIDSRQVFQKLPVSRHDPISQLTFVRNLFQHGLIEVDKDCARVLRLSNEEYMFQMEEIYTNTSHEKSILEIAELAIKEGKWEKAALRLQAILDHFPRKATPATYFQLGEAYRKLGNIPAADNVLRQGVEKYPQSLHLAINFAKNSMAASDWRETANRWQSVLDSFHEKVPDGFRGSLDEHTSCGV